MSTKTKPRYSCELCKVTCMSAATLQSHLRGAKHTKRKLVLSGVPQKAIRSLKDYIDDPKRNEPLIGLEYVVEYDVAGRKHLSYFCKLCRVCHSLPCMIEHLNCVRHRKAYINKKCQHMKISPTMNSVAVMRQKAKLIEETEGIKMYTIGEHPDDVFGPLEQPTEEESKEPPPQKPSKSRWETDDEDTENESSNIKKAEKRTEKGFMSSREQRKRKSRWDPDYGVDEDASTKSVFLSDRIDRQSKALKYLETFEITSHTEASLVMSITQNMTEALITYRKRKVDERISATVNTSQGGEGQKKENNKKSSGNAILKRESEKKSRIKEQTAMSSANAKSSSSSDCLSNVHSSYSQTIKKYFSPYASPSTDSVNSESNEESSSSSSSSSSSTTSSSSSSSSSRSRSAHSSGHRAKNKSPPFYRSSPTDYLRYQTNENSLPVHADLSLDYKTSNESSAFDQKRSGEPTESPFTVAEPFLHDKGSFSSGSTDWLNEYSHLNVGSSLYPYCSASESSAYNLYSQTYGAVVPENTMSYGVGSGTWNQELAHNNTSGLTDQKAVYPSATSVNYSGSNLEGASSYSDSSYRDSSQSTGTRKTERSSGKLTPEFLTMLRGKDVPTVIRVLKQMAPFYPALQKVNISTLANVLAGAGALD